MSATVWELEAKNFFVDNFKNDPKRPKIVTKSFLTFPAGLQGRVDQRLVHHRFRNSELHRRETRKPPRHRNRQPRLRPDGRLHKDEQLQEHPGPSLKQPNNLKWQMVF